MQAIEELLQHYQDLRIIPWPDKRRALEACIDWAIERLRRDEEGDDLQVLLLAGASHIEEAEPLVSALAQRYLDDDRLGLELAAGKALVRLHQRYRGGEETPAHVYCILDRIWLDLGCPGWLSGLGECCELGDEIEFFAHRFESEFDRLAALWSQCDSFAEFERRDRLEHSVRGRGEG